MAIRAKKKKATSKKTPAKKVAPKKATPKKSPAKKAAPVKKTAKKTAVKKSVPAKTKQNPKKTAKSKLVAKKSSAKTAKKTPAKKATPSTSAALLPPMKKSKVLDLTDFVTPLDDRLMVQVSGAERVTAGGIYIPDTVGDSSGNLQGVVVAVGRGHISKKGHLRPMDVKVGDKIVFPQYAGSKVIIQNEDLIILREAEVMGVVSK